MKSKILGLLTAVLLAGPMAASAVSITLDNANVTALRPLSGSVIVDFFGTVALDTGEHSDTWTGVGFSCPYHGALSLGCSLVPIPYWDYIIGYKKLFDVTVESSTQFGLYQLGYFEIRYHDLAGEPTLASVNFSVNVVDRVPEPGTLALFGLGLAGLGFTRRRNT